MIERQNLADVDASLPADWPPAEELSQALTWLESQEFAATSRLPLFTARHWSPELEQKALLRFRQGRCNIHEVAVPRWYWRGSPLSVMALFGSLTLGQAEPPVHLEKSVAKCLLDPSSGQPRWRLVQRFSRIILHSRPGVEGDEIVYFGDDTLFLMKEARQLVAASTGHPLRFLDLCCGGGGVGLGLPPFEGELVGIDINPTAIAMAKLAAAAQGLPEYHYLCSDIEHGLQGTYDLVVGNPPTLPPELGGQPTLYATGSTDRFLVLLEKLMGVLAAEGQALLTVFSTAEGCGPAAFDLLRNKLGQTLKGRRGYRYSVRRQFPLGQNRWLRHVALRILPEGASREEEFQDSARFSGQLPALRWRRRS